MRVYDGHADCILNLDNKALYTWELLISYLNEYATTSHCTFFSYW